MKWSLINEYDKSTSILDQVLKNRGIKSKSYLFLTNKVLHSPHLLDNIDLAADILLKHCKVKSKILIVADEDCDGYTSAAAMFNYLTITFPDMLENIKFVMHEGKLHKIIADKNVVRDFNLVIVPDAGSNDVKEQKFLYDNSVDLIILDHHETEYTYQCDEHFALVNNQASPKYPNKMLSGVGIVWKFLQILDERLNTNNANYFLDLVAVGLAADMQSCKEEETAYLIREGLKNENLINPYISYLVERSNFTIKEPLDMNYITVSFSIAPFINSMTRVGTLDEKELLFKSMLFHQAYQMVPSTKRGHKIGETEYIVEQAFRVTTNVKNRQKKIKDEGTEFIKSKLKNYDIEGNKVIILNTEGKLNKNLTGLVANEIAAEYQKPVALVTQTDEGLTGSMRGYDKSELKDFKKILESCKNVSWVRGHANAAGCNIINNDIPSVIKELNEKLHDIQFVPKYDIDYIINQNDEEWRAANQIIEINQYNYIWGRGCEEPLILVKDFIISTDKIHLMARGTLKFELNNEITAIKFHVCEEEYEKLIMNDTNMIKINIVGRCKVNNWNGNKYAQVEIVDYEFSEYKENQNQKQKEWVF